MAFGVLTALVSALCYGLASVLQSKAAQAAPMSLSRLAVRPTFVAGVLLDVIGFAAQFLALRVTAVFVVQAAQAASLAVTAAVAVVVLHARLHAREWAAVAAVCVGLAALGWSAGPEGSVQTGAAFRIALLAAVPVLAGVGLAALRIGGRAMPVVLGGVAGLGFGVVALAARALTGLTPGSLIRDPAAYALLLGALASFGFYATGLQRGSVTVVTAATIAGETLMPAIIGVVAFGDHTRSGLAWVAVVGFATTLAAAGALARFGEPSTGAPPESTSAADRGPTREHDRSRDHLRPPPRRTPRH